MKLYSSLFLFLLVYIPVTLWAQVPAGYYNGALGLNGQPLRIALYNIIKGHTVLTYTPGLWNAYYTTDKKPNGKLWDIYSDIPGGTPAYEYTLGTNQCSGSSANHENSCYNREHTWPQSKFGSATPMQTDLFIVYPTDYYVNNQRGDFPYGIVGATVLKTFTNGTKLGTNVYAGAPTTTCFEPIDSFKGDIARNYFYVSTRYWADSSTFINWEMATNVNLNSWAVQMLLEWHNNDPVSQKEIDRNDSVYALQHNRNPFIDYPQFADCIWGTGDCSNLWTANIAQLNTSILLYPNPATDELTIKTSDVYTSCTITNSIGQVLLHQAINATHTSFDIKSLPTGLYFVKCTGESGTVVKKFVKM